MVKFSVIIPTYNRADLIQRCIDSVLKQSYQNFEVIVVDNYSEDATVDIVKSYADSRIKIFQIHNHGIIAASRNKGIMEASGEWICFLDSDDWWTSNKLETCLHFTGDYDMIYHGLFTCKDQKISKKTLGGVIKGELSVANLFLRENLIANSSVLVRRELIQKEVGLLSENPRLVTVEDLDYWVRVIQVTHKIKYIDAPLGYYWIGNNASGNTEHAYAERALLAKYIQEIPFVKRREAKSLLSYKMARVFHQKGRYRKAIRYYCGSFLSKYKLKSILLLSIALLHIKR